MQQQLQQAIRHKSFKHGWFYHYRVHLPKSERLCTNGLDPVHAFLHTVFDTCPDAYFLEGPRSSALKFPLPVNIHAVHNHELSRLASVALEEGRFNTAHTCVEMHLLQNDANTISIEAPLWAQNTLFDFSTLLGSSQFLTGHIDILRIEDGKIWIWDFKPNAHKEKYAATQTFAYAVMLAERTGIPLEKFMCGYFDQHVAYIFKPEEQLLMTLKK